MKITCKEESKKILNMFWKIWNVRIIPKCVGFCESNNSKLIALQKKKGKGNYMRMKDRIVIEQDGLKFISRANILYGKHHFEDISTISWMTYYDEAAKEEFTVLLPSDRNIEGLMMFSDTFLTEYKNEVDKDCVIDKDDLIEAFFTVTDSHFKAVGYRDNLIHGPIGEIGVGIGRLIDEESKTCVFTRFMGFKVFEDMVNSLGGSDIEENRIPVEVWLNYHNKTVADV